MNVCVMGGAAGGRAERVEPQLGLLQLTQLPVVSDEVRLQLHDHPQPRQDHLQEAVAAPLQEPESLHAPDHLALDPARRHQGELWWFRKSDIDNCNVYTKSKKAGNYKNSSQWIYFLHILTQSGSYVYNQYVNI